MGTRALFVVGAPRSGTSLTRDLLRQLPGVYLPPDEIQVIPSLVAARNAENGSQRLRSVLLNSTFVEHMRARGIWMDDLQLSELIESSEGSIATFIEEMVLSIARQEKQDASAFWGDKTPENIFHIDQLKSLWPSARFIYVERDPRDTVLSMHKAWGRSIIRAATIWRDSARAAHKAANKLENHLYFQLRYEDLTKDPAKELSTLAHWLGVQFKADLLSTYKTEERWGRFAGKVGVGQSSSDWQNVLTREQILEIESVTFSEMVEAGYLPVLATKSIEPSAARLSLAKVGDAWRVLGAYTKERGFRAALKYKLKQWANSRSD